MAVQRPCRRLHCMRLFFPPLNKTEHGSQPSLTTRDRELVSVLEVRIEPGDLNQGPLTQQSVTLPTIPRAGLYVLHIAMRAANHETCSLSQPQTCDRRNARPKQYLCGHSGYEASSLDGVGLAGLKRRANAFFIGLSCSIPTIIFYVFSLSLLSVYKLVLWGKGLRTDRVYITLSQPCTADLF